MKFCEPHWDQLKEAIEKAGLAHLISKSGEEAAFIFKDEMEHGKNKDNYDPLMAAYWAIVNNAIKNGGMYLMFEKPDGTSYCPLCELDINTGRTLLNIEEIPSDVWIRHAVSDEIEFCKNEGLLK